MILEQILLKNLVLSSVFVVGTRVGIIQLLDGALLGLFRRYVLLKHRISATLRF